MTTTNFELEIAGLGKVDAYELRTELPNDAPAEVRPADEKSGAYHEPGTVLIVVAAGAVVLPTALLFLARRRKGFDLVEETRKNPDGSEIVSRRIRVRDSSISPQTIEKLRGLLPSGLLQRLIDIYAGKPE
jgi:hypothetical protein